MEKETDDKEIQDMIDEGILTKPNKSKLVDYPMNKNETNKWEEEFDKEFGKYIKPVSIGKYDKNGVNIGFVSSKDKIKQFIQNLLKEQEAPMGVSQWRELGKKYGYDKYFEELK